LIPMNDKHSRYIVELQPMIAMHITIVWRKLQDQVSKPFQKLNNDDKTNHNYIGTDFIPWS